MKLNNKLLISLLGGLVIFYIISSLFRGTYSLDEVPANPAFDDINFYKCVIDAYNKENKTNLSYNTNLTDEQLKTITNLICHGYNKKEENKISSIKGVEKITSLTYLAVYDNKLTELDVSQNLLLENLSVSENQLTELDVSNNIKLTKLSAVSNRLTSLDVSNNVLLSSLSVGGNSGGNQLTELDVSQNLLLENLSVSRNQLTELDVSQNTKLTNLSADSNRLTSLDVSNNVLLSSLLLGIFMLMVVIN